MTEPTNWLPPTAYPPTAPLEPLPAPQPREVPLWAPFAALLAVFFVISLFAATAGGILAAGDAGFDAKHPPMGLLLGLMAVQNALFILVAWLTVRLSLGRTPPERLGLRRVADVRAAALWAAAVFVGFWLVTA